MAPCVLLLSRAVSLLLILPLISVLLHYWWCFHLFFPLSAVVALPLCFPLARQGCLCVNPGQLAKGTGGGSYAELAVHPMPQEMLAKKQEGEFTFVVAGINAVSRKYATEAVRATAVFGLHSVFWCDFVLENSAPRHAMRAVVPSARRMFCAIVPRGHVSCWPWFPARCDPSISTRKVFAFRHLSRLMPWKAFMHLCGNQ